MTEAEWLSCTDPTPMLEFLRDKASDRKLRLFAAACCRQHWDLLIDERSRNAVEFSEQVADGISSDASWSPIYLNAWAVLNRLGSDSHVSAARAAGRTVEREAYSASCLTKNEAVELAAELVSARAPEGTAKEDELYWRGKVEANKRLASLLQDIFGNPIRPVTADPNWLTPNIIAYAKAIYDEQAFDRLRWLGKALDAVGCDNEDIWSHCRSGGPHVRGCWVVDLLLGKE